MHQIAVNGLTRPGLSGPENWGELLDLLERGGGSARQIVTAVRFGGVAVPTFRDPLALARDLAAVETIEVETATVDDLVHESAQAAYDSIAPLTRALQRIAQRIRAGYVAAAHRSVPQLTASIQSLTTVTAMLAGGGDKVRQYRADLDALVLRLCGVVEAITERQARDDWFAVADVLETELAPTLAAWASVVRRIWAV